MNQLSLQLPLSRKTDPRTSADAADRVDTFKARHEAKIYDAIFRSSVRGSTMREIAEVTHLEPVQVGRRLSAMGERGLIARREIGPIGEFEKRDGCAVWWVA